MKLTKENFIITIKLLESRTISNKRMAAKEFNDDEINSYYNGRIDTLSFIRLILEDEKEFEKLSTALMKMTNRYGHDGSAIKEDK